MGEIKPDHTCFGLPCWAQADSRRERENVYAEKMLIIGRQFEVACEARLLFYSYNPAYSNILARQP